LNHDFVRLVGEHLRRVSQDASVPACPAPQRIFLFALAIKEEAAQVARDRLVVGRQTKALYVAALDTVNDCGPWTRSSVPRP
jgi:hypothetical protein